jgi:hypothetical protein
MESVSQTVWEGVLLWWCEFNASVSAQEGRRWKKVLPEDEAEASSSFCFNGKKM